MKHRILIAFLVGAIAEMWGCASHVPAPPAPTSRPVKVEAIEEILTPSWPLYEADQWSEVCVNRFGPGCVVVFCHGWYTVAGHWLVFPELLNPPGFSDRPWPIESLIAYERVRYPEHTIVFLCCNADGTFLHGYPHVYYSLHPVWLQPDSTTTTQQRKVRHLLMPDNAGNAYDLLEAR